MVEQLSTMKDTPRACMKGFRLSTASITDSLQISEYEWPFFASTSIWRERQRAGLSFAHDGTLR